MRDDKTMAAAILNPPFAIHARRAGLKDMGAVVDTIGPYLGTVPYVLRAWAHANAGTLAAYLAACIEGLALDSRSGEQGRGAKAHRRASERAGRHRGRNPRGGVRSGSNGLARDAAFDLEGFKTVLEAPRRFRGPRRPPPEKYFDLSFHRRALAGL